jgi:extradiol dioxygenase family protein
MKTETDNAPPEVDAALDNIDHIAITVDDLDKTVEFYLQTFKAKVLYRDDTWAFLRFGNIKLAFVIPGLKTHRDGTRSIYLKDPSANTIEIMAPLEPGQQ